MKRAPWEEPEVKALVRIVKEGRTMGRTDAESFFAAGQLLDRPTEGCRWVWQKWQRENKGGPIQESPYPKYDQPLTMEGNALILGDLEAPFQKAEFVNKCLAVAEAWGVKNLILGGDALHFESLSSFEPSFVDNPKEAIPESVEARLLAFADSLPDEDRNELAGILADIGRAPEPGVSGELAEVRTVFRALEKQFERIDFIIGNHEARLVRALERALCPSDLMTWLRNGDKWRIAPYYFSFLISGGIRWKITHPKPTGKGSSKRLAGKLACNVIMLHNHHFSIQTDPTGQYLGIEPGCCVDEERLQYAATRDTAVDTHVVGAVMIIEGKPWLLNDQMTDWDRMLTVEM